MLWCMSQSRWCCVLHDDGQLSTAWSSLWQRGQRTTGAVAVSAVRTYHLYQNCKDPRDVHATRSRSTKCKQHQYYSVAAVVDVCNKRHSTHVMMISSIMVKSHVSNICWRCLYLLNAFMHCSTSSSVKLVKRADAMVLRFLNTLARAQTFETRDFASIRPRVADAKQNTIDITVNGRGGCRDVAMRLALASTRRVWITTSQQTSNVFTCATAENPTAQRCLTTI